MNIVACSRRCPSFHFPSSLTKLKRNGRRLAISATALAMLLCAGAQPAGAVDVFDNFNDGNDTSNPTWIHLNNAVGSTGQTWDATGGAYHLQAPGNSMSGASAGYGFVGSYVPPLYTDVRVTADVLAFPNVGLTGSFFGISARLNGNNSVPFVSPTATRTELNGYSYQYEASAAGGAGEIVLSILHGGGQLDVGSLQVTLDNTKDYRFVLEVVGNLLHGKVFELDAGGNVVTQVANNVRDLDLNPAPMKNYDGDAATPDQPFVPFTSGYSGLFGIGHAFYTDADVTFDNFRSESLVPSIPGDFDDDGDVDSLDLATWKGAFGLTVAGDADGDNDTDGNDFLIWQRNYTGALSTGAVAAVPEPTTAALAVISLVGVAVFSIRRRRTV